MKTTTNISGGTALGQNVGVALTVRGTQSTFRVSAMLYVKPFLAQNVSSEKFQLETQLWDVSAVIDVAHDWVWSS